MRLPILALMQSGSLSQPIRIKQSRSCFATEMYFVKKNLQFTFPCEFSVTAQDDNYLINYYLSLFTEASQIQFTGNYKIEKP